MPPTDDRRQAIALFRYALIREAADPALGTRERGALVRALAERDHLGPTGERVRVSRNTLDRWIRAWRVGGFPALLPDPRVGRPRVEAELLALAVTLKREQPRRAAAQIARVITEQCGTSPHERTLQRHFRRVGLDRELAAARGGLRAFGRFQAEAPNQLWTADALHGPAVAGRKAYLLPPSTTTPAPWSATAGPTPRTPSGWRPRYGPGSPPAACPAVCTSTTARRSSPASSSGLVRCSASALSTRVPANPRAAARSSGSSAPCASSSWSSWRPAAAPRTWRS